MSGTSRAAATTSRTLLRAFGGLNETYSCNEAEAGSSKNFSSRDFPALSTRIPRRRLRSVVQMNGIYHLNGLLVAAGKNLIYNSDETPQEAEFFWNAVADSKKKMVGMGTRVIIFPDKIAFDTRDRSVTKLGAVWDSGGADVVLTPCDASGKTYTVSGKGTKEPENPADGQLFLKVNNIQKPYSSESVLEVYNEASGNRSAIELKWCRIEAGGIGKDFAVWDTVTVSGVEDGDDLHWKELKGDRIVTARGDDWVQVQAEPGGDYFYGTLTKGREMLRWTGIDGKGATMEGNTDAFRLERRVPDLDYLTECDNRLWGCAQNENVIYGCKLGDPTNWRAYQGVATDSYAVTVGTPGPFTGAAVSGSAVIFFKENCLHRVYGTQPSNFTVYVDNLRGVQQGCHKSAVRVNEYLYYKSVFDVCVYADSEVAGISAALGTESYKNAVAGVCGSRLYLSMEDQEGAWQLLVYDTAAGVWTREDGTHALGFASCLTETFMLRADGELYALLPGEYNKDFFMVGSDYTVYAQEETDEEVSWELRTGEILRELPDHKYIGKIQLYLELDPGARAEVALRRDGGAWEKVQELSGGDQRRCTLPIYPRRCDRMEIRLTGVGHARLVNWSKYVGYGSEY